MTAEEFNEALAEAEKGNAEVMVDVALAYFKGIGTPADPKKAMSWLEKGAALGNADAQAVLVKFFNEWLADAEKGDTDSQLAVGVGYLKGTGTEADYKQGIFWLKKAAAHGSITTKLATKTYLMFAEVLLPTQNFRELFEGAQKGNANLQYGLGFAYLRGYGTEFNHKQALLWFQKAAAQGHTDARRLQDLVQSMISLGGDKVETYENITPNTTPKGKTRNMLISNIVVAAAISYLATGLDIGWLHSLAIIFNISWILYFTMIVISYIMILIWPKRAAAIVIVLYILYGIAIIGPSIHYIKGRSMGNPVSIILQNPFEAVRTRIFGASSTEAIFIEQTFPLDMKSENGAAKIFEVQYNKDETVIRLIRTTGSHRTVDISPPGEANSFYVKDAESEETWPLKETRPQDYEDASGVDLVFAPFADRSFDLIEGGDTSEGAWHFRNVAAGEE
jgi:hypothetical protein